MSSGWLKTTLSEVASIQSGAGFPEKYQGLKDQAIPFYKVSDMNVVGNEREMIFSNNTITETVREQLGAKLFPSGSIIFPKIGGAIATNKKRLTSMNCCVDNNVMGAIPRVDRVDPNFLFYFFQSFNLSEFANEAHLPSIRTSVVANWHISVPVALAEQQRIVAILDEAFDGIATAKVNAEKNLQNARALYASQLQSIFDRNERDWEKSHKPLSELCDLIVDCEHKTAPTQEEGIPSIRTPNIGKGKLLLEGVYRVSEETYKLWTRRAEPMPGDLILAREAPAGNVAIIPKNLRVCLGQRTVLIRPNCQIFESEFLALTLLRPAIQQKLLAHSRGATVQHVNVKDIRALDVGAVPPLARQRDIISAADKASQATQRLESIYQQKLAALDELKKSLLHQAFTGAL